MQIFSNLLSNAVKYTQEGGKIQFFVEECETKSSVYAKYRFLVSDNGMGMSADFKDTIFDAFTRAESSLTNKIQGTGLGMAITKNLVEAMGGTIDVESELGQGSCFEVLLDLKIAEDRTAALAAQEETDEQDGNILQGMKFLCAEDNELNAEILTELLKIEGAECTICENGEEILKAFEQSAPGDYDMILMDVQMPVMNGYEATRAIRRSSHELAKTIPIIAMTANAFSEDIQHSLAAGMNAHVSKPVEMKVLEKTIRSIKSGGGGYRTAGHCTVPNRKNPDIAESKRRVRDRQKMKGKRVIAGILLAGILAVTLAGCKNTDNTKEKTEKPVITLGSDSYPPYNYLNEDGVPTGIDVELAAEAFKRMGYQVEVVQINWEKKKELVESGEIDCIMGCFSMEGRLDDYRWAGPYIASRQVVAVNENSDLYKLSDLAGKNLAVQSTTKPEGIFLNRTDQRIPKLGNLISLGHRELIYTFLGKGYVDAVAAHEESIVQYMKDYDTSFRILEEPLMVVGIGVAFAKEDDRGICEQMDQTLEEMRQDGTSLKIIEKYLDDPQKYLEVDDLGY